MYYKQRFLTLTCLLGPSDEHIKSLQLLDTGKVINVHERLFLVQVICDKKEGHPGQIATETSYTLIYQMKAQKLLYNISKI